MLLELAKCGFNNLTGIDYCNGKTLLWINCLQDQKTFLIEQKIIKFPIKMCLIIFI